MDLKIIGISGVASSGKDTLFKLLDAKFPGLFRRFALADELKADLNDFLKQKTGISAFTIDPQEKSLIRDLLVAYGKIKRLQSQGKYWTNLLQPKIDEAIQENIIPVLTDIRYDVFPEDECFWLQNKNRGQLIHVSRNLPDGAKVKPPNADETLNDPRLEAKANYTMVWPTLHKAEEMEPFVYGNLENLMNEINRRYEQNKRNSR